MTQKTKIIQNAIVIYHNNNKIILNSRNDNIECQYKLPNGFISINGGRNKFVRNYVFDDPNFTIEDISLTENSTIEELKNYLLWSETKNKNIVWTFVKDLPKAKIKRILEESDILYLQPIVLKTLKHIYLV
jgi:hypothetical protein